MTATQYRLNGIDRVASAFIGEDRQLHLLKWTGESWEADAFAPPPYMTLIGFSPGIAYEPQVELDDVLTGFVTAEDSNGNSVLQRFVWRRPKTGSVFGWREAGHLPYGLLYASESDIDVHGHTITGAAPDSHGRLLIPTVGQGGAVKVIDVGPPDHKITSQLAFSRPALHRVDASTLYAFATAQLDGTLVAASNTGEPVWHWRSLGAPAGRKVKSAPAAIDFHRGTPHTVEAFVICDDGHLWSCSTHGDGWHWFDRGKPPGTLYQFSRPGATTFADPATGALQILVFVFDIANRLFACRLDGNRFAWSALGAPAHVDLAPDSAPGVASATRGSTRYVHAFVRGTAPSGPRHYQCEWDGHAWAWQDLGATGRFQQVAPASPAPVGPRGRPLWFRITAPGFPGFCSVIRVDATDAASAQATAQTYCDNCAVEAVDANATCNGF